MSNHILNIDSLKRTMKKKQFVSKAKEASMSYNTVKKYKLMIDDAEKYRTQGV